MGMARTRCPWPCQVVLWVEQRYKLPVNNWDVPFKKTERHCRGCLMKENELATAAKHIEILRHLQDGPKGNQEMADLIGKKSKGTLTPIWKELRAFKLVEVGKNQRHQLTDRGKTILKYLSSSEEDLTKNDIVCTLTTSNQKTTQKVDWDIAQEGPLEIRDMALRALYNDKSHSLKEWEKLLVLLISAFVDGINAKWSYRNSILGMIHNMPQHLHGSIERYLKEDKKFLHALRYHCQNIEVDNHNENGLLDWGFFVSGLVGETWFLECTIPDIEISSKEVNYANGLAHFLLSMKGEKIRMKVRERVHILMKECNKEKLYLYAIVFAACSGF